jgi:ectoine hydroxylase-related dioxygenase (phytanoyl-CoA dioxygenase family)
MATEDCILEIQERGYCVLRGHWPERLIGACREAFWPVLTAYIAAHGHEPNRGPHRHFLPMPFEPPCYAPEFFFDPEVLRIVQGLMDDRVVADQWGCDVPLRGSEYQSVHVDYQGPLFAEAPDLPLPVYMLVMSFPLVRIAAENGPIEIAAGTHRMARADALRAVEGGDVQFEALPLEVGDVLIRHPWTLHRGPPNRTDVPRALATVRYVRRWYADDSREVNAIGGAVWQRLDAAQRVMMRFPVAGPARRAPPAAGIP